MINARDVITLKIPFPTINDTLALQAHMYVCYENSDTKKLIKVQTYKPLLLDKVNCYIDSDDFLNEHPFKRRSLIDLDKFFICKDVTIPLTLKVKNKNGTVSKNIYNQIDNMTKGLSLCKSFQINSKELKKLNHKVI
ncbi:hypothetical protein BUY93_06350 [Mammaliicoccus fleurettii]|nr:hypothetical protein BUY93_06350 [Mammaliicoccus fleurettii]